MDMNLETSSTNTVMDSNDPVMMAGNLIHVFLKESDYTISPLSRAEKQYENLPFSKGDCTYMNADTIVLLLPDNPVTSQTCSPVPDISDSTKESSVKYDIEFGNAISKY